MQKCMRTSCFEIKIVKLTCSKNLLTVYRMSKRLPSEIDKIDKKIEKEILK